MCNFLTVFDALKYTDANFKSARDRSSLNFFLKTLRIFTIKAIF